MLNFTPAEVTPGDLVLTSTVLTEIVAEVRAPQAAIRPLTGFGAGAFASDGAQVGSAAKQLTAGPALPRIRDAFAVVRPVHPWAADGFGGAFLASTIGGSSVGTGMASTRNGGAKQLNQTTRICPVAPGGLGPHPAREPDPV
jgi:hypothetical protein